MRKLFALSLLISLSLLVGEGLYLLRDGFSPRRLQTLPSQTLCSIDDQTKEILSQRFYFLGKGRQCFAFSSEDGKYVLKTPRTNIYKLPFWARALPVTATREKLRADKTYRRNFVFESFRLAHEELKNETGTMVLHLGKSAPSKETLTLIDPLGVSHHFPMDSTIFILQHKHPLWTHEFLKAKDSLDTAEQTRLLNALVDCIIERSRKGCFTRDRSFLRNYGFDGVKAYQIDIGDLYKRKDLDPNWAFYKSVHDTLAPVQEWLANIDPPMLELLNERLQKL